MSTCSTNLVVPMLTIGGVRYLPLVRYRLTPFGTEWSLVNELRGRVRPTQVELRVGRAFDTRAWGVGVRHEELPAWQEWTLGLAANAWQQPAFAETPGDPFPPARRLGAHVRGRLERPLIPVWFSAERATLVMEVGLKSAGFVPGEPLGGGFVTRAGVGLPLAH